jgi:2-polyprenyl-6-hydroxyphenyl methylase/3-demethylubiquinone-9 3-methyltransferase
MRRKLWNKEFRAGRWNCLEWTPVDCVYPYVEKYCNNGDILDLGCGSGNTGNELDINKYTKYTGVDISDIALKKAEERSRQNNRSRHNSWLQAEMTSYRPKAQYDVILFRESLFYVRSGQVNKVLIRLKESLKDRGVFIVRIYDRDSYAPIVSVIRNNFQIVEEYLPTDSRTIVVVFR